jgi:hypothetical protein
MSWAAFRGWQKFAFERNLEKQNNEKRREAGLAPVKRQRTDNGRGPQEAPDGVKEPDGR